MGTDLKSIPKTWRSPCPLKTKKLFQIKKADCNYPSPWAEPPQSGRSGSSMNPDHSPMGCGTRTCSHGSIHMNMYPCTLKCIRYPPKLIQFMWLKAAQPTRERSQQMTSAGKGGEIDWLPNGDLLAKTKKETLSSSCRCPFTV